jgi:DNA primase
MAIPEGFIQELLARADVVDIVGRHVQLKKAGANWKGLCPFHGEKSPSFTVSPSKQFYHCFGCGKNGTAISFLMEHTGASFPEAVKDLAQQYGLQVPEDTRSSEERARDAETRTKQATLTDILAKAGAAYRQKLKESPRAIDYLKGRGLSGEIAKRYGLGYSPEGWTTLAGVFPDYQDSLLVDSGLVIDREDENKPEGERKRYDRFRDRVMFPIRNVKGEVIGFGGRILDKGEPKYLNSPETPVFSKGRELYGLFEARETLQKAGYVLVTEGYMDVVALAQLGFPNAVATLGTACTSDHVQKLFRFTDHIVFSFDGDGAGRRAARKALDVALPFASDTRTIKFLFLPSEHDPDSFIRENGADAFARYVSDATPLSRFLLDAAREGCDLETVEGRSRLASIAKPLWQPLPDGALKRQLLREIASLAALGEHELTDLWNPAKPSTGNNYQKDSNPRRSDARKSPFSAKKSGSYSPPRLSARNAPPTRADRALQILLLDNAAWEQLSNSDHHMLCELPQPHGALFSFLDAQIHEHGSQNWAQLMHALNGHEQVAMHAAFASRLIAALPDDIQNDSQELTSVLKELRKKAFDDELAQAAADPAQFGRYKELLAQKSELS